MRFLEHAEAGRLLARQIAALRPVHPVVLVVPPSGPRIGREIARQLGAPMDVLAVRDVSIPGRNCAPIGAVVDGAFYLDEPACRREGVTRDYAALLAWPEQGGEERWERAVRRNRPPVQVEGATVIVVSDVALPYGQRMAIRVALEERRAARILHAAAFARPGEDPARGPIPAITLFSAAERCTVMLVNAGDQQTTDDEIADLLVSAAGT